MVGSPSTRPIPETDRQVRINIRGATRIPFISPPIVKEKYCGNVLLQLPRRRIRHLRPQKHAVQAFGSLRSEGSIVFYWQLYESLVLSPLDEQKPMLLSRLLGLTIGSKVDGDPAKDIIKVAFENGINMFDTAEAYGSGGAEFEL